MKPKEPANDMRVALWFMKPYWARGAFVFTLLFVYSGVETISIGALFPFMNSLLGGGGAGEYGGRILGVLEEVSSIIPVQDRMVASSLFLLGLVVVGSVFGFVSETVALWFHLKLYADQQIRIFERLIHNQFRYFGDKKLGEMTYIGREAATAVGEMFFYFPKAGVELLRILAVTLLLLSISVPFTVITYGVIAMFGVMIYVLSVRIVHPAATRSLQARSQLMSLFSESMLGIRQIKIFDGYGYCSSRYKDLTAIDRFAQFQTVAASIAPQQLTICTAAACGLGAVVYVKMYRPAEFASIIPTMVVFIGALMRLMPAVSKLGHHWMGLKGLGPRLRVTKDAIEDAEYVDGDGTEVWRGMKRGMRLDRVSFSYRGRGVTIDDVTLDIGRNQTVAIVGESGSGKSTLADLLLRLYDPDKGKILADGDDCADFTKASWLAKIGMVSQDTFIFHATIRDNIRMGDPGAGEESIVSAAKIAHAHDFISEFPEGYGTVVGDRGLKLSGGQRQRIAIARAIIRDPDILILDEATSSLDAVSERIVQEAIQEAKKNRTTIVIAHRLSTIEHADVIFVLNKGKVVERGCHRSLLEKEGFYHRLYQKQKKPEKQPDRMRPAPDA